MDAARDEEAQNGRQPPRSSLPTFLFISFMLFMLTSHNGDEFLARHRYQDALQALTNQLSNYTAWMNHTESNFTLPEADATLYPLLQSLGLQGRQLDPLRDSYYSNVTGFIHGKAAFHNITNPTELSNDSEGWAGEAGKYASGLNTTALSDKLGSWSWNTTTQAALSVMEKSTPESRGHYRQTKDIIFVHGKIDLKDEVNDQNLRLEFEGVHFLSNGTIHGFAEPVSNRIDIRLLPSLVPNNAQNATSLIIAPELQSRIRKLKELIDAGVIDTDSSQDDDAPKTTCSFTFHAHIQPAPFPEYLMQELEEELQNPTGISTVATPNLNINGVLLSKECGVMLRISDTEGLRAKVFFRKLSLYAGLVGLAYLAILLLFTQQANRSRTPSGISRLSVVTFLTQATMDSVSFAGHTTFAILAEGRPSLSLMVPAFLSCILFIQEAQFAALIYQIQGPENFTPTTPPSTAGSPDSQVANITTPSTSPAATQQAAPTPAPAPAQQTLLQAANENNTTSFFAFFIHHVRTDPQARLWVALFIFLVFVVRVILSPMLSMLFVAITYSGLWLPQIIRSVRRGRSSGLSKSYIVGTTVSRLFMALYFLACPKNVLEVEPRGWIWPLALFVCAQASLVMLQDIFGPSFFLPAKYTHVQAYDYHPPLGLPDSEAPEQSLGDCSICMDAIMVDNPLKKRSKSFDVRDDFDDKGGSRSGLRKGKSVLDAMQRNVGASAARKNYSLAPCSHIFHTECLEKWLAIKNICPQCRRPLPPL